MSLLIDPRDTVAVLLDWQDHLVRVVRDYANIEHSIVKTVRAFRVLDIPIIVTQQYTAGLGKTTAAVSEVLGDFQPLEKHSFSAYRRNSFVTALRDTNRKSVVLMGAETHICVEQTALQLLSEGYHVYLLRDCSGSRHPIDRETAERRMACSGVVLSTSEAIIYEAMLNSDDPHFKEILEIVKS